MKASLQARVWRQAMAASAVIITLCGLLLWSSHRLQEAGDWVDHTQQVLNELEELTTSLLSAETGQRGYLLSGNPRYLAPYESAVITTPEHLARLQELTANSVIQRSRLRRTEELVKDRLDLLSQSVAHAKAGRQEEALAIARDGRGNQVMEAIRIRLKEFGDLEREMLDIRRAEAAHTQKLLLLVVAFGGVSGAALILLFTRATVEMIVRPVRLLRQGAQAIAAGDFGHRLPKIEEEELGGLADAFNAMAGVRSEVEKVRQHAEDELRLTNDLLARRSAELEYHNQCIEKLAKMAHRLQTSQNDEEFAEVVRRYVPQIIPDAPGALYFVNNSRNLLEAAAVWGDPVSAAPYFAPDYCWGVRRGQAHVMDGPESDVRCAHVGDVAQSTCRPLLAQGEMIGVIYLEAAPPDDVASPLSVLCENISLALSNNRLRASLREQSIRDPLTGLFNRRYMDEALQLEFARAARCWTPLSVVMFDVDHFKRFNDTFGHDAGDALLRAVGRCVADLFRDGDIMCRYGGEEFVVILAGANELQAVERAEALRERIKNVAVTHMGQPLSQVSISVGVASYPDAGVTPENLLRRADEALYAAKHAGRDQVMPVSRLDKATTA